MRNLPILLILLSICVSTNAQELHVEKSKKVFLNDLKVKKGDTLKYSDIVLIKPNGTLTLLGASSKPMKLNQGTHKLEAKYREHLKKYQHHDSIFNQLKLLGLENCDFPYDYVLVTHNAHALVGQIEIERDSTVDESSKRAYFSVINTNEQHSVQINWTNPDENYQGKYFILVEDIFEDFQELLQVHETHLNFDLTKYISEQTTPLLIFTIIAEDCRESAPTAVMLKTE
jgi:hypothetical protein